MNQLADCQVKSISAHQLGIGKSFRVFQLVSRAQKSFGVLSFSIVYKLQFAKTKKIG